MWNDKRDKRDSDVTLHFPFLVAVSARKLQSRLKRSANSSTRSIVGSLIHNRSVFITATYMVSRLYINDTIFIMIYTI